MRLKQICITIALLANFTAGVNILGLMGVPSPSHHNWNRQLFLALAKKGHNLTILSTDVDKENTPNLHYIWAEKAYSTIYNESDESINIMDMANENSFSSIVSVWGGWAKLACKGVLASEGFKTLMNYPDDFKFDLVLFDFTCGPCILGFLHKFKYPPLLGMTAFSVPKYIYQYVGGYRQPSYVPHYDFEYHTNMNFVERLNNHLLYGWEVFYMNYFMVSNQNAMMRDAFKYPDLPHASDLQKKMAIALVNTHFSYETVEPLPPNVIPVGGLQIKPPQPLKEKIRKFVETSEKGAVLFSLGTNVRSEFMTLDKKKAFIAAFAKFPDFHFVWKYESDLDLQLPKNVMIQPWVKQNDILAHPKTKAFISHCGLLSTQEAAWYGVPVIGIPFFADQYRNIRSGVNAGTSVKLVYQTMTQQDIENALQEVLLKPSYKKNAEKRSSLFQDQIDKPIDRAVFWAEWLIRHPNDCKDIQLSRVHELGWLAANSYDMLIVAAILGTLIYYLIKKFVNSAVRSEHVDRRNKQKGE